MTPDEYEARRQATSAFARRVPAHNDIAELIHSEFGRVTVNGVALRTATAEECEPYEILPRGHGYAVDESTGDVYEVRPNGTIGRAQLDQ